MYYTIYKVTNKINGKIYIGCHKTANLNDGYIGSGKYLNYSIQKHGLENFNKEILHVFSTAKEMYAKEAELVDEEFIAESNTYNLKVGGSGGFDYINKNNLGFPNFNNKKVQKKASKNALEKRKYLWDNDPEWRERYSDAHSLAKKKEYLNGRTGSFTNKQHTDETKTLMSAKAKERLKDPTKNSQYGTCWIYNNQVSKKIKKDDLQQYLDDGWIKGRKIKF